MDGKMETYKARLVSIKMKSSLRLPFSKLVCILPSSVAGFDYKIWQMDVKIVFLNNYLEENIYMMQPTEYITIGNKHKVCKLLRSIYGLNQASHSWNQRFNQVIKTSGFEQNVDELCVYKRLEDGHVVFLVLYVDDILLIRNDVGTLSSVKLWLTQQFSMEDLGAANFVLGIRIIMNRKNKAITLSQALYIDNILESYTITDSKK
ncbi:gag/pol protein [Gossypium australe]|uniref:Gag/pol protein n=1 Tax=Gossypium australe TaxID=47621 RepID=A0A5B6UMA8_9ROSI|nr:gag/pol protein [Gossypium australe]